MAKDLFEYNLSEINKAIDLLSTAGSDLVKTNDEYIDYVHNNLEPNWDTKSGKVAVEGLINFLEQSKESFSNDLNNKMESMEQVYASAQRIDNA